MIDQEKTIEWRHFQEQEARRKIADLEEEGWIKVGDTCIKTGVYTELYSQKMVLKRTTKMD